MVHAVAPGATTTLLPDVPLASSTSWRTVTSGAVTVSRSAVEPDTSWMTDPAPQPNTVQVWLMVSALTR